MPGSGKFDDQQTARKIVFCRLLKKDPAFAETPALRKSSGGGASRRQADAS